MNLGDSSTLVELTPNFTAENVDFSLEKLS